MHRRILTVASRSATKCIFHTIVASVSELQHQHRTHLHTHNFDPKVMGRRGPLIRHRRVLSARRQRPRFSCTAPTHAPSGASPSEPPQPLHQYAAPAATRRGCGAGVAPAPAQLCPDGLVKHLLDTLLSLSRALHVLARVDLGPHLLALQL